MKRIERDRRRSGVLLAAVLMGAGLLGACSGSYEGTAGTGSGSGPQPGGGGDGSVEGFFAARVQPRLDFCRSCHLPGGVADVEDGDDFALSANRGQDLEQLRASWQRLGGNNPVSRILLMASGQETPHSGGQPWPQGGNAYRDVAVLLGCFESPAGCLDNAGSGPVEQELPLLGSKRGGHLWASFCEDKPDSTPLPADPRSLVRPGFNDGRAVHFNAWWEDCHVNAPEDQRPARTCGEYRARRDRGLHFLMDELPGGAISAAAFNDSWQKWGLSERPENFDQLYTLRYGLNAAPFRNPYPLPGEDPNATDGGSGQLPLGLRQTKDENGSWTGRIASGACFQCHGGQIGDPFAGEATAGIESLGLGNNNYDTLMAGRDNLPWADTPLVSILPTLDANTLFNIGVQQRGQNNAVGAFELLNTILDIDSLGVNPMPGKMFVNSQNPAAGITDVSHPLAHTQDTPPWWNMGSRPRKFFDAGVSNDSTRIIMAAGPGEFGELFSPDGSYYRNRIEEYDQDLEAFFLSLRSPPYPEAIDEALARQGAILFHTKDLWAEPGNSEAPRPAGGNGSCASCHGVYAPRYANDPAYLESPLFEGMAGHIVELDVIGTDPARSDMLTPTLRVQWDTTYWAYPEGVEGYVAPEDKNYFQESADDMSPLRPVGVCGWEKTVIGYQAPPLHGVWATAPYLHNGSVPTIEQLLDSSQRAPIWRRQLQTIDGITGFDQRLGEAYDFERLGWKHEALSCSQVPGNPLMACNPVSSEGPSLPQIVQNLLNGTVSYAGLLLLPDPTPGAFDKRLIYDTRILGNDDAGHAFSDVLTTQERRAIIEYLKTL